MTSKERFLRALAGKEADRLPVTTHHLMPYFLKTCLKGISDQEFFNRFNLDAVKWVVAHMPDPDRNEHFDPAHVGLAPLEAPRICSEAWQIRIRNIPDPDYTVVRYEFITPERKLSMMLKSDAHTTWVSERMIKEKSDIDVFAKFAPMPLCDVERVNTEADLLGEKGLVRGTLPGFDVYGQPGCWQDAAVLYGIEKLILQTYDDPEWVHSLLNILLERKKHFVRSMEGARFDLVEHGGGDASSTVISPRIFEKFVTPYDSKLIEWAHRAGQRVVYHTCGGMMPILEMIAGMNPDAMETFTPPAMGGDADLREAKKRIGHRVCMIGGFDQFHFFKNCTGEETRQEVRRCFEEAGAGGGYILAPSDHFFDADVDLLDAYADEAQKCRY